MDRRDRDEGVIAAALRAAGFQGAVRARRDLSGGCIHRVIELELDDGTRLVAKLNAAPALGLFQEESESLRVLAATRTVIVPQPLVALAQDGQAALLMTRIARASCATIQGAAGRSGSRAASEASEGAWRNFGRDLATLHRADVGSRFGFHIDNHIGATPQPNEWSDDWVEFNARHRLGHQLHLARDASLLSRDEAASVDRVIDRLDRLIPRRPRPSLIHGDLWAGNAIVTEQDGRATCAVIDPACSIGDGWADIAMMRLFGGFAPECFASYSDAAGGEPEDLESRIAVYQLYHVLNHVNLFGRGYAGQAVSLARSLL
jgi:fructosamine-3-kinase